MAVEAFVWRTYEATLPADAVELNIGGHRAAQYWIMKPTDWNDRWWITCMIAFKTSYGVFSSRCSTRRSSPPTTPTAFRPILHAPTS